MPVWAKVCAALCQPKAYQAARKLPRGPKGSPKAKARGEAFGALRVHFNFNEFSLHAYATRFSQCWIGEQSASPPLGGSGLGHCANSG